MGYSARNGLSLTRSYHLQLMYSNKSLTPVLGVRNLLSTQQRHAYSTPPSWVFKPQETLIKREGVVIKDNPRFRARKKYARKIASSELDIKKLDIPRFLGMRKYIGPPQFGIKKLDDPRARDMGEHAPVQGSREWRFRKYFVSGSDTEDSHLGDEITPQIVNKVLEKIIPQDSHLREEITSQNLIKDLKKVIPPEQALEEDGSSKKVKGKKSQGVDGVLKAKRGRVRRRDIGMRGRRGTIRKIVVSDDTGVIPPKPALKKDGPSKEVKGKKSQWVGTFRKFVGDDTGVLYIRNGKVLPGRIRERTVEKDSLMESEIGSDAQDATAYLSLKGADLGQVFPLINLSQSHKEKKPSKAKSSKSKSMELRISSNIRRVLLVQKTEKEQMDVPIRHYKSERFSVRLHLSTPAEKEDPESPRERARKLDVEKRTVSKLPLKGKGDVEN